jgi:hypothetical protein
LFSGFELSFVWSICQVEQDDIDRTSLLALRRDVRKFKTRRTFPNGL